MQLESMDERFINRMRFNTLLDKGVRHKIIFITAEIGWGKTIAVLQWANRQQLPVHWINIEEGNLTSSMKYLMEIEASETIPRIIVVDNFHLLTGKEDYTKVIEYIKLSAPECRFVLISRSWMPKELQPYSEIYQLELITEEELSFSESEIRELFMNNGYDLDFQTVSKIREETLGCSVAINILLYTVKQNDGSFGPDIYKLFQEELISYYDRTLFSMWSPKERRLLMILSMLDEFNGELAAILTGFADSAEIIDDFSKKTKAMIRVSSDTYRIKLSLKGYLERKRNILLTPDERKEAFHNAGVWYEAGRNMVKAFEYYNRVGSFVMMIKLLENASEYSLYTENFDELAILYKALPEDIIMKSHILCGNMVCLHSICYRTEEAYRWFYRLLSMRDMIPTGDIDKRKRLEERIIYTEIILPGTGEIELLKIFRNMIKMGIQGTQLMNRVTLTGNLPSILKGYKDLSLCCNHLDMVDVLIRPVIENLFQIKAVGATDIYKAEVLYEKNQLNTSLLEVTKGIAAAEKAGTPEVIFAGYALLARIMVANGQLETSKSIMENISGKLQAARIPGLISNHQAYATRYYMLSGNKESTREWLKKYGPDLRKGFRIFDCYQYSTEARIYLQHELYTQAIDVLERLHAFYIDYRRPLDLISTLVLRAIAFDRIGEEDLSYNSLDEALKIARRYRYIRCFADEGEACYKLLIRYSKSSNKGVAERFLKDVIEASKGFALLYPKYLEIQNEAVFVLTKAETETLKLIERGMSNSDIADFLAIRVDTVKFHTKNIYSKLAVKNRMQAVIEARKLKII